jgi:quercetin dioxygenase-like cupin family protein
MTDVLDTARKLEGAVGGSTYITPSEMDWKPTRFEKISIKVLYEDIAKGEMTCLLKLEPGAYVPFHKHPEIEQTYVLEGSVEDHDGVANAGDYIWRKSGSQHDNRSPSGAVILAVTEGPTSTITRVEKRRASEPPFAIIGRKNCLIGAEDNRVAFLNSAAMRPGILRREGEHDHT